MPMNGRASLVGIICPYSYRGKHPCPYSHGEKVLAGLRSIVVQPSPAVGSEVGGNKMDDPESRRGEGSQ